MIIWTCSSFAPINTGSAFPEQYDTHPLSTQPTELAETSTYNQYWSHSSEYAWEFSLRHHYDNHPLQTFTPTWLTVPVCDHCLQSLSKFSGFWSINNSTSHPYCLAVVPINSYWFSNSPSLLNCSLTEALPCSWLYFYFLLIKQCY